jgi:hypothetical protein
MNTATFRLSLCLLGLVTSLGADYRDNDRRPDNRRREEARVILFEHAGYGGDGLVLYPGEAIENMSGRTFDHGSKLNDAISSLRLEGNVEVYVYENAGYRGEAMRLTESARDLTGRLVSGGVGVTWNDRISSIRVEWARGRDRDRDPGRPGPGPGPDRPRMDPEKIIKGVFGELLGREPSAGELRDFRMRLMDQGWTERMLRDHLRTEDNYRREAADLIVRRAYRDVLGREADESGLRTYRRNVLERGWTESDVRDSLRKSAEFRNKPR